MERDIHLFKGKSKENLKEIKVIGFFCNKVEECISILDQPRTQRQDKEVNRVVGFLSQLSLFKKRNLDYVNPKSFVQEILRYAELESYPKNAFIYDYGSSLCINNP